MTSRKTNIFIIVSLVLFNIIVLLVSYKIDSFKILKCTEDTNGTSFYEISNSNLMIVIVICVINVLAIYHIIISGTLITICDEVKKINFYFSNYDEGTISFKHLSEIELGVGLNNQNVHNEIWVVTNNFEEKNDSKEGQRLRDAIIANLKTNVDYYYVIPKSKIDEIEQLGDKLRSKIGTKPMIGKFQYIIDDALDFIPIQYFDIIMYIKITDGEKMYAESSSQIYYCFSKNSILENCFYQRVDNVEIWNKLIKQTRDYKEKRIQQFKAISFDKR